MNRPAAIISDLAPGSTEHSAPDWDRVPFEVGCARCGNDLRGRIEPKCPACELEFDWSDAVPIEQLTCLHCDYHLYGLTETRCPECGQPFEWDQVLDEFRRRQKPFFEYEWRRNPVRSLLRTWWWALWPPRLWRRFDIHDPPRVGPLLAIPALCLTAFLVLFLLLLAAFTLWYVHRGNWRYTLQDVCDSVLASLRYDVPVLSFLVAAWLVSLLTALMLFRQSMRRCRVRTVHVLRVWGAHSKPDAPDHNRHGLPTGESAIGGVLCARNRHDRTSSVCSVDSRHLVHSLRLQRLPSNGPQPRCRRRLDDDRCPRNRHAVRLPGSGQPRSVHPCRDQRCRSVSVTRTTSLLARFLTRPPPGRMPAWRGEAIFETINPVPSWSFCPRGWATS